MPGWNNGVSFGQAFQITPSDAEDIDLAQRGSATYVSILNINGSPEGSVDANPSSFSHDPLGGAVYIKESGVSDTGWSRIITGSSFTALPQYSIALGTGFDSLTYLATTATAGQVLQSGGGAANPVYSTATYPSVTTINRILYSSAANTVSEITTANNSILSTDGSGVPSFGTSLANDYSFTQSNAGSSRVVTASNSDNTNTASNAYFNSVVGGTSGGDAWHQVTVGTARSYVLGVDNSDSQSLKMNTTNSATLTPSSGTNLWKMTSAGERTMPLQPAFAAQVTTTVTNATGDGTVVTIVAETEIFDQGSDYDTGTGTFTAPVTGRYLFNCGCQLSVLGAGHTAGFYQILTSNRFAETFRFNPANLRDTNNFVAMSGGVLIDMDASDTMTFRIGVFNSTKTVSITGNANMTTFITGQLSV